MRIRGDLASDTARTVVARRDSDEADMDIERDLLLGILAIQGGYINLDQYSSACRMWASEKSRPLVEVLLGRGWIGPAEKDLLEASLARRLSAETGGAAATLAIGSIPTIGATGELPRRPIVSTTVTDSGARLGTSSETLAISTGNETAGPAPSRDPSSSRYSLLAIHGEGGLGRIWRARDNDLNRDVALKEIQPHLAHSPTKIQRFVLEAQVTGQLEHPNIVPVYELSYRAQDGQPFYIMRFVRGKTLSKVIAEYHEGRRAKTVGRLEFARLLGRFYGVCYAVGYAHSRGVIHRDLKPDNVVLGDFAEVNLLDWGLAKLVDIEESSSESSIRLSPGAVDAEEHRGGIEGTPAYMAPEQVDARFGPIGTHADIYGLGSILFEILTGSPPHRGEGTMQLLDQIVREETPLARQVEPSVHPALEAICAKAMAKDLTKRYDKAADLALDLQRFMNDEPTTAYREPPLERMARWARRHRTWTQAAAVALVLVTCVSIFASVLITGAQRAEASARHEAQERYVQARGFADTLLAGVSEDLKDVPGAEGVQKKLLEKAAEAYQEFASDRSSEPGLQLKAGQALLRLAEVRNLLHDLDGAVLACRAAESVFNALATRRPSAHLPARWRAESQAMWGRVLNNAGKNGEALIPYHRAMDGFDAEVKLDPDDPELLDRRANCSVGLALVLQETGDLAKAESTYLAALKDYDHIIADAEATSPGVPVKPAYRYNRARGLINLSTLLDDQDRRDDAERRCRAAIADLEILVKSEPEVPEYLNSLAASRNNLGLFLRDRDLGATSQEAEKDFTESVDLYETLVYQKTVPKHMNGLVRARVNQATLLAKSNEHVAEDMLRAAIYDSMILVRVHQDDPSYLESLLRDQKKSAEAVAAFDHAVEAWRDLKARSAAALGSGERPKSKLMSKLRTSLYWRCYTLIDLKKLPAAIADLEEFPALFPDDSDDQYNAACCWSRASAIATDPAQKHAYAERAVKLLARTIELKPEFAPKIADGTSPDHDPDLDPIRDLPSFKALRKPKP
jgi:tetratricopeptide (TPR) repeat protein